MWQKMEKGFTLIELMVVISIIVILVAMLYPSVMSAVLTANAAVVQVRITELGNACTQYRGDNNYYPGQNNLNRLNPLTGSQLLAEALFIVRLEER